jgi:hypothetical protein
LSDVPQLQDAAEFHVHLGQRNHSGKRTNISSRLELLEIDADIAN